MISVELWRARIGHFNGKVSGCSLLVCVTFRHRNRRNATTPEEAIIRSPAGVLSSPDEALLLNSRFSTTGSSRLLEALVRLVLAILAIISLSLIISGDVEVNPGPLSSDRPLYNQLLNIKKANGTSDLKIIHWITSLEPYQCIDFAHMLLKDDVLVSKYEKEYKEKNEFVRKVLRDWLSRNDDDKNDPAVPRTWSALAECVTDVGLDGTLTKAINDACPPASNTRSKTTCSNKTKTTSQYSLRTRPDSKTRSKTTRSNKTKTTSQYSLRTRHTLPDSVPARDTSNSDAEEEIESDGEETEEEEEIDSEEEEDKEEITDEENSEDDNYSTASSDISDWTTDIQSDEDMCFISSRKRSKSRREYSDESSQNTETSSLDEDEPVTKKRKSTTTHSLRDYWPPDWLKSTKQRPFPYFPQVGDKVVYCKQGHELYRNAICKQKTYPWKHQQMPWEKFKLMPHEFCKVRNVHFVVGPPTLCSITLELLSPPVFNDPCSSKQAMDTNQRRQFTFKYHDMEGVFDFLILEQVYKDSLKQQWSSGDRFQSLIDDQYWSGTILKQEPFSEDTPDSEWQKYHVKWDDDSSKDQLSPWDLHPIGTQPRLPNASDWDNKDKDRILQGLEYILKNRDALEEARMFLDPVDLKEESKYCTVVACPTSISTIAERLRNGFYRQKISLIWEVTLLARNAREYNEEDSVIVKNGKAVVQTLLKFIKSHSNCSITECHLPDLTEAEEFFTPKTNSSPVKTKSKEQEVLRSNNTSPLQRKRRERENDVTLDETVSKRVTRSCATLDKSFDKLSESFEDGEEEIEDDDDDDTETESDDENKWP